MRHEGKTHYSSRLALALVVTLTHRGLLVHSVYLTQKRLLVPVLMTIFLISVCLLWVRCLF